MAIQIKAGRDVINLWVDVTVTATSGRQIANVTTTLDEFPVANDDLNPPQDSYQNTWHDLGLGTVGATHKVEVTAVDDQGKIEAASKTWQDQGGSPTGP